MKSPSSSVSVPTSPSESDSLVCLANAILSQCHVDRAVHSFAEIDVDLFVTVFEALAGERLDDIFRPATTEDERVHNAQVVIDSLSMDILHTSLSHVEGSAIAAGDVVAVKNLLEIFAGLLEFILGKISEGDVDGDGSNNADQRCHAEEDGDLNAETDKASTEDDADIPSFLRTEAPPAASMGRRRSVGSVLPMPVAQSSLQSSKQSSMQSSEVESVHSQGTSTAAIVKESELIAERLGLRPTGEDLEATCDIGREGIEKAMKAQEEMRLMLARWTREDGVASPKDDDHDDRKTNDKLSAISDSDGGELERKTPVHGSVELLVQSESEADENKKDVDGGREGEGKMGDEEDAHEETNSRGDDALPLPEEKTRPEDAKDDDVIEIATEAEAALTPAVGRETDEECVEVVETEEGAVAPAVTEEDEEAENHLKRLRTLLKSYETLQSMVKDALKEQGSADVEAEGGEPKDSKGLTSEGVADEKEEEKGEEEIVIVQRKRGTKGGLPKTLASRLNEKLDSKDGTDADAAAAAKDTASTGAPFCSAATKQKDAAKKESGQRAARSSSSATVGRDQRRRRKQKPEHDRSSKVEVEMNRQPPRPVFDSVERSKTPTQRECRLVLEEIPVGEKMTPRKVTDEKSPRRRGRSGVSPRPSGVIYSHDVSRQRRPTSVSPRRGEGVKAKGEEKEKATEEEPPRQKKQITFAQAESPPRKKQQGRGATRTGRGRTSAADVAERQMARVKENVAKEVWREGNKQRIQKLVLKNILEKKMKENEAKVEGKRRELRDEGKMATRKYFAEIEERREEEEEEKMKIESGDKIIASALSDNKCCHDEERLENDDDDDVCDREDAFLKALLKEFPHLHLSRDVLHRMWLKAATQMDKIKRLHSSSAVSARGGVASDKAKKELEDARRKYALASSIRRKEAAAEAQRVAAVEEKRRLRQMKSRHAEKRHLKARTKKYYDELVVGQRAKMLKAKADEELVFKRLFAESVKAQQQQLREFRKLAAEVKERRLQSQRNQLDSMENYYRDQFSMLSEALNREQYEEGVRQKEQRLVLTKMQRHLRLKMEDDIRTMQEQMRCTEEDSSGHFRDVQAQLLSKQLHVAW